MAKRQCDYLWTTNEEFEARTWATLWCDKVHIQNIAALHGVYAILQRQHTIAVGIHPRYSEEEVRAEIQAIIEGTTSPVGTDTAAGRHPGDPT